MLKAGIGLHDPQSSCVSSVCKRCMRPAVGNHGVMVRLQLLLPPCEHKTGSCGHQHGCMGRFYCLVLFVLCSMGGLSSYVSFLSCFGFVWFYCSVQCVQWTSIPYWQIVRSHSKLVSTVCSVPCLIFDRIMTDPNIHTQIRRAMILLL